MERLISRLLSLVLGSKLVRAEIRFDSARLIFQAKSIADKWLPESAQAKPTGLHLDSSINYFVFC